MDTITKRIEDSVYDVLLTHSNGTFPISPVKIARSMGIKVIEKQNAGPILSIIDPDGAFQATPVFSFRFSGGFYIIADASHGTPQGRRARVAHEIGHFLFDDGEAHSESCTAVVRLYRGIFARSPLEICCDLFALALLVPQMVLKQGLITSQRVIAELCHVSNATAHLAALAIARRDRPYTERERQAYEKFKRSIQTRRTWHFGAAPIYATDVSAELAY